MKHRTTYHTSRGAIPQLITFALACTLACAAVLTGCTTGNSEQSAHDAETSRNAFTVNDRSDATSSQTTGTQTSHKLDGAQETTDENGIVHGVSADGITYTVHGRGESSLTSNVVTLAACGDQIGTDNSLPIARSYGAAAGTDYDFTPFYQDISDFVQSYDLRYINQETVMAGEDAGYSGYPIFNTPDAAAEAIHNVGYNLVNFATNHTYDMGTAGIERSHEVFAQYPELIVGGSYLSEEARDTVQMIERNGITFAFLAYTYGDNMYLDADSMPNSYYSCVFDEDTAAEDIARAKKVADVVIVSMHWGSEYVTTPNDQQLEWAQFLVDQDVDLVLGTHAHILQPTKLYTSPSGKTVPVVFGLSDFISGWTITDCIISGIFTCEFTQQSDGSVTVQNPTFYPCIEWSNGGDVYVRMLKDLSADEMDANTRTEDVGNDSDYIPAFIDDLGMDIPVVM